MKPFQTLNYYELLEVPPTATPEEIVAAHQQQQALYAPDSVALYALEDTSQAEELRRLLTEAMEILSDADLRAEYHKQLGLPPPSAARPPPAEPGPAVRLQAVVERNPPAPEPPEASVSPEPTSGGVVVPLMVPLAARGEGARAAAAARAQATEEPELVPDEAVRLLPEAPAVRPAERGATPGALLLPELSPAQPSGAPSAERTGLRPPPLPGRAAPPQTGVSPRLEEAPLLAEESALASAEAAVPPPSRGRDGGRISKVEVSSEAEFNGELLRRIRESRGTSLQQLADRTRISSRHLENIEADRYRQLPAAVYLRGMLMSIAKELQLDPARVSRSYMDLVARATRGPSI